MARISKIQTAAAASDEAPAAAPAPKPERTASPSEQMIAEATRPATIKDSKGRTITMRKPGVLAQFRLVAAMGEDSGNQALMQMVMPLIYLGAIDGDDIAVPASRREVDALIQRLDEHGLEVVMVWYMQNIMGPTMEAMKEAEQKLALKN